MVAPNAECGSTENLLFLLDMTMITTIRTTMINSAPITMGRMIAMSICEYAVFDGGAGFSKFPLVELPACERLLVAEPKPDLESPMEFEMLVTEVDTGLIYE
jgi:hypothetical protein